MGKPYRESLKERAEKTLLANSHRLTGTHFDRCCDVVSVIVETLMREGVSQETSIHFKERSIWLGLPNAGVLEINVPEKGVIEVLSRFNDEKWMIFPGVENFTGSAVRFSNYAKHLPGYLLMACHQHAPQVPEFEF